MMKKLVSLPFIKELEHNLSGDTRFIQVILGPRQVGKTTTLLDWLEQKNKNKYLYFSADSVFSEGISWIIEKWELAIKENKILAIDEIQKIERWSEIVKKIWDAGKRTKKIVPLILLGSGALNLHSGLSESLTGRFQLIRAPHWNFNESNQGYDLSFDEFLKFGGYPGTYDLRNNLESWANFIRSSIISTVIEKDILNYRKVKSPSLFKQCFEMIMGYPAQEISYTKLLGQLQEKGNTELIKHYLHLFESAFLIRTLDKFSTSLIRSKSSSPKILPLCPSLYFSQVLDQYGPEEKGRVFEMIVGGLLCRTGWDLYYWRDGKHEVDFVVKFGRKIWAIEVKSGRKQKLAGMSAFLAKFPQATPVIINFDNFFDFDKDPRNFLMNNS